MFLQLKLQTFTRGPPNNRRLCLVLNRHQCPPCLPAEPAHSWHPQPWTRSLLSWVLGCFPLCCVCPTLPAASGGSVLPPGPGPVCWPVPIPAAPTLPSHPPALGPEHPCPPFPSPGSQERDQGQEQEPGQGQGQEQGKGQGQRIPLLPSPEPGRGRSRNRGKGRGSASLPFPGMVTETAHLPLSLGSQPGQRIPPPSLTPGWGQGQRIPPPSLPREHDRPAHLPLSPG